MDYATFNSILTKFGKDKCLQIFFKGGKVLNLNKIKMKVYDKTNPIASSNPLLDSNGKLQFYAFDDLVTIDQATGTLLKKENNTVYNGLDSVTYYYNGVYLIEDVVSFNFIPSDYTEDQIYAIRRCWNEDH